LAILNAVLLTTLVVRATGDNLAMAAPGRPADYLLISGEIPGGPSSVVFVLDTTNSLLGGMAYTQQGQQGRLEAMPRIDLSGYFNPPAPKKGR